MLSLCAVLVVHSLPPLLGSLIAALCSFVALAAGTVAFAGVLVLLRCTRAARGQRDLFLELNRSREPEAIKAGLTRTTRLRRWLARRLMGYDLLVGDTVVIKSWDEIRATLDDRGCLEELPFMPEMLASCGQRAVVFRCVHRLFDYRKSRRMRHMDRGVLLVGAVCEGSAHGGCEAACHTIWKPAWLRRAEPDDAAAAPASTARSIPSLDARVLQAGTLGPRYTCQLTQLHAASRPIARWTVTDFLLPVVSGNVAPAAFVLGWLTYLFNLVQHRRQGISFPEFEAPAGGPGGAPHEAARLQSGDPVVVRSAAQIRATLDDQLMHRGMWFEPDMLKHCGHRYRVQAEISKLIDIVTGEIRTMKTPAYVLRDVHFSGERQLFNAQHEPLFWRGVWLQRDGSDRVS
jgi:hypothetical protein